MELEAKLWNYSNWNTFYHTTIVWSLCSPGTADDRKLFTTNALSFGWHWESSCCTDTIDFDPLSPPHRSDRLHLTWNLSNVFCVVLLANVVLEFNLERLNWRHVYLAVGSREWDWRSSRPFDGTSQTALRRNRFFFQFYEKLRHQDCFLYHIFLVDTNVNLIGPTSLHSQGSF